MAPTQAAGALFAVPLLVATAACVCASVACEGDPAPSATLELGDYVLRAPADFRSSTRTDGPRRSIELRAPDGTAFCSFEVISDGRVFGPGDMRAFLSEGRAAFGVGEERPAEIATAVGTLTGFSSEDVRSAPGGWFVAALAGDTQLEIYARAGERDLIAVIVATFSGAPDGAAHRASCRQTAATLALR